MLKLGLNGGNIIEKHYNWKSYRRKIRKANERTKRLIMKILITSLPDLKK